MMNEKVNEQLSALIDDELPENEQEFLMRRIEQDAELRSTWSRYHLIGDVLRNKMPMAIDGEFSRKVSFAIDQVSRPAARQNLSGKKRNLLKPLAGLAVAASVAMMAIVGLQNLTGNQSPAEDFPKIATQVNSPNLIQARGTRWDRSPPEVESRLNGYLVNHGEYANSTNLHGMLQYARIAGYDSTR